MKLLHRLPFLRLLLFFCAGILFHLGFPTLVPPAWILAPLFAATLLSALLFKRNAFRWRWVFGTLLFLFLSNAAILRTALTAPILWDRESASSSFIVAEICESPNEKRASYGAMVHLHGEGIPAGSKAMLYLAKDSLAMDLKCGDQILFPTNLIKKEESNPYTTYLHSIGCSGTIYLPRGRWKRLGHANHFSLAYKAQETRKEVERKYAEAGLSGEELAILSALTLGDKSQLTQELKASYATTGASHILAVSGLHVGIVYWVIITLLSKILPGERMKKVRVISSLTVLWGYAFIAGLSASVVRASIMLTLVAIGELLERRALTLNTLFASAFCMLLYHPRYLTDVGFQLSYTAVLSILLFQERIYKALIFNGYLLDKIWSLTSVSIAAQLGTLPIVLFHFHRFSNLFGLSGLIVIPVATLLIYAALLLLLCTPFPTLSGGVAWLIIHLTCAMNQAIRWMEQLPHASVDNIDFNGMDVLFLYLLLGSLLGVTTQRSFPRIAFLLILLFTYTTYATMHKMDWI